MPVSAGDSGGGEAYAATLAAALRSELGGKRAAAKTLMRWTGASERTAKAWLGGISGPSGEHLIALLRHSDAVFALVLRLSGRVASSGPDDLAVARRHLLAALAALDRAAGNAEGSLGS
ncbi:MAG: hypothetical protein IRZ07_05650 [Microbispora sp.]|nr:hypothetical protein [Microbispora sp.]